MVIFSGKNSIKQNIVMLLGYGHMLELLILLKVLKLKHWILNLKIKAILIILLEQLKKIFWGNLKIVKDKSIQKYNKSNIANHRKSSSNDPPPPHFHINLNINLTYFLLLISITFHLFYVLNINPNLPKTQQINYLHLHSGYLYWAPFNLLALQTKIKNTFQLPCQFHVQIQINKIIWKYIKYNTKTRKSTLLMLTLHYWT